MRKSFLDAYQKQGCHKLETLYSYLHIVSVSLGDYLNSFGERRRTRFDGDI